MPDEKMNWDPQKGVVTLQKGESTKTFDLSKDEDRTSFMKLGQRGWYFDEDASKELGELRKIITNWDTAIQAAKNDDEAMGELIGKLELAIGRPLTKVEKKTLEKENEKILDDDDENSKLMQTLGALKKELDEIKKSRDNDRKASEEREIKALEVEIKAEAAELEKKYNGKDGSPKFERKAVFAFAAENKIDNLETAFKLLNFEQLTEHAKKKALKDYQDQIKSRKTVNIESGEGHEEFKISDKSKAKSYHQLGVEAGKLAKEKGLSLTSDD